MPVEIENRVNLKVALWIFIGVLVAYLAIFSAFAYVGLSHGEPSAVLFDLHHDPSTRYDTDLFVSLGNTLLKYHEFAISPTSGLEYNRTPGYPFFIAAIRLFTNSYTAVLLVQIVLTALTAALIYLIGVRYMNRGAAIFAAIVYTLDLTVIICAFTLISEALFMVLLVASVYCIGISSRTWWVPYAASAICIALAIYVRPPAAILLVPPILGMALARSPWRTVLRGAFVYVAVIVLMVTPWMIRNHVEGGHFAISSAFVYNVFYYNVPLFEAVYSHGSEYDIQDRFATELGTSNAYALGQFSYEAREAAIIRAELAHRWFAYGLYHLAASIKLFGDSSIDYGRWQLTVYGFMPTPPPGAGSWSMLLAGHWQEAIAHLFTNIPKVIERLYWLVIIIAAGYTFVIALIKRSQSSWFSLCAVLIIVVSAIVAGPLSDDPRYRLPLEPFLLLLAAPAVVMLINKVRHHLQKTFLKEL